MAELRIPRETGLIVVAVRKDHKRRSPFVFNPSASTKIEAEDDIIVLGDEKQIESLRFLPHLTLPTQAKPQRPRVRKPPAT